MRKPSLFDRLARASALFCLLAAAGSTRGAQQPSTEAPAAPAGSSAEYRIGIGDVLQVGVWKNPELTATVPVRPDGYITVPLIGDVAAAGLRPEELQAALGRAYERYVSAPAVSVVVKEIRPAKIFITGEVTNPGAYDLQPRSKLLQALAMAGGVTAFAKDRLVLLRDAGESDQRFEIRLSDIVSGRRPLDNMLLQAGDTIVVP